MENDPQKLQLKGFVTSPPVRSRRAVRFAPSKPRAEEKRGRSFASTYLFIRLGVCVLLFCGVLALRLSGSGAASSALSLLGQTPDNGKERDTGSLGRLRFVQIPSIIDVFAPSSKPILPAEAHSISLAEDDTLLLLYVEQDSPVYCPRAATVRAVGSDAAYGRYVRLVDEKESDIEYYIAGFANVLVEQGQPVAQRDILGAAEEGELCVRVYKNGRPMKLAEYFDLGSRQ